MLFCFKQLPLNTKQNFESSCYLIVGKILLSVVVGVVSLSADKPLDFHYISFSLLLSVFKL